MYHDNSQKAKYAIIFITISIFITLLTFFLAWKGYNDLLDASIGNNYSEEELSSSFIVLFWTFQASQLFKIVAAIFFLIWFYHAYKLLKDNRLTGLLSNSGFAVGSFFIPLVNLFFPVLIMIEIHKGSYELTQKYQVDNWKNNSVDSKIIWWWFFWIGRLVVFFGGLNYIFSQIALSNLTAVRGVGIFLIYFVFELLAGILLIFIIREINGLQKEIIVKEKDEKDLLYDSLVDGNI